MKVTACECERPGPCSRHGFDKTEFDWELCRRRPDFFAYWDGGGQPARAAVEPPRSPCRHRSAESIDTVLCQTCPQATVHLKVFACALFERCAEARFGPDLSERYEAVSCPHCLSYAAPEVVAIA